MNIAGTQMHIVTFVITIFELAMLFFQIIYFLERPGDRNRLMYLVLLIFLILYNVCSGLFPDPNISVPVTVQVVISYLVGFTMSMYVVYYFYRVFELEYLRSFATKGIFLFLLLPFLVGFLVPYLYTGDLQMSRKLTVIVPFFYGLGFIFYTTKAIRVKYLQTGANKKKNDLYGHAIAFYISVICWATLPVIVFFGDFQVIEHSVTNAGFLLMSVIYVRSSIYNSRSEYKKLMDAEMDLKQKVETRTAQLKQLNDTMKNVFINVAHEIKTPLMLVNNYLHDFNHSQEENDNNKTITNARVFLSKLTSDVVDLFDIQSLKKGFAIYDHGQASSFSQILGDKLELFKHDARKRNISVDASVESELLTMANPHAVERITNNLIANAIKFSRSGGHITIGLHGMEEKLIFEITDEGVGMDDNVKKRVFEPFYRADHPFEIYRDGLGLGLAIVKGIVDSLNGNIQIDSKIGIGTKITVTLKRYMGISSVDRHVVGAASLDVPSNPPKDVFIAESVPYILLVENNVFLANYLAEKLGLHFNTYVSLNGSDAIRRLPTLKRLDLVVCDIMMEKVNGYDFFRLLSSSQVWKHVPFIFITARSGDTDRLTAFKLGAIHFLEKPFLTTELILKITAILSNIKAQHAALVAGVSLIATDGLTADTGKIRDSIDTLGHLHPDFTRREKEIVKLVITGKPYKEIADRLNISVKTVSRHVTNIYSKMAVSNRVELAHKLKSSSTDTGSRQMEQ